MLMDRDAIDQKKTINLSRDGGVMFSVSGTEFASNKLERAHWKNHNNHKDD